MYVGAWIHFPLNSELTFLCFAGPRVALCASFASGSSPPRSCCNHCCSFRCASLRFARPRFAALRIDAPCLLVRSRVESLRFPLVGLLSLRIASLCFTVLRFASVRLASLHFGLIRLSTFRLAMLCLVACFASLSFIPSSARCFVAVRCTSLRFLSSCPASLRFVLRFSFK